MTAPIDPRSPERNPRGRRHNRTIITAVLGIFVVAVLAIALWGGFETADIEAVPDEARLPAPGEGSLESGATGATQPPAPVFEDPETVNDPVITE